MTAWERSDGSFATLYLVNEEAEWSGDLAHVVE